MENKDKINLEIMLSRTLFDPLVERCFGTGLHVKDYRSFVEGIMDIYKLFRGNINLGNVIVARRMFIEDSPMILRDAGSIGRYENRIKKYGDRMKVNLKCTNEEFEDIREIYNNFEEAEDPDLVKILDGLDPENILEEVVAYGYWGLLTVSGGRRVGVLSKTEDGKPNFDDIFYEFKHLGKLFPKYNQLKAYAIDLPDAATNCNKGKLLERLDDAMDFLEASIRKNQNPRIISKLSEEVRIYAMALEKDYGKILKSIGYDLDSSSQEDSEPPVIF